MKADAPVKISVIMPVYNRAQTLPKAVRSVLSQTLREIELLCINDGSTDNTVMVLKELAQKDARIKVLSQRNAGAGPARNYGLKRAKGEFVAFLDSDDWYASEDVLAKLYEKAIEHHVKICLGGSRCAKHGILQPLEGPGKIYFTKEALIPYQDYQFTHGYWRGIYERRMLMDHEIRFPAYRRYQDPPFFVRAMICAERFYALSKIVLIYDESRHYEKINWNEQKVTDLLRGIRDILRMAEEHSYIRLQKDFIERIRRGDWAEIFSKNLHRSWSDAKNIMQEANEYFLPEAMRQWGLPEGEKPFDRLLRSVFGCSAHSQKSTIAFYPYGPEDEKNCYIKNIKTILSERGRLQPFVHGVKTIPVMLKSRCIFLNWFENKLTTADKFTLLLARLLRKKIIWTFHNVLPHGGENATGKKNLYFMCRVSTDIILLSRASRTELSRLADGSAGVLKKAVYIPHINYCNNYLPGTRGAADRPEGTFVFLYFGNIRPYKNLEMLIHTFHDFGDRNAMLVIAGNPMDAQYAKKIRALCAGNEHICLDFQYIPDSKVFDYMQTADVVILPYDKRSSLNSGAMIAAFSCKKPVIVPDIAMARDYQEKEYVYQYHYRCSKEHEAALKDAMLRAYEAGKDKNLALGEAAYQDVMLFNSMAVIQKEFQTLLP